MICPKCHSDTHVKTTIKYDTVVKRFRVCIHCNYAWTTSETWDEERKKKEKSAA